MLGAPGLDNIPGEEGVRSLHGRCNYPWDRQYFEESISCSCDLHGNCCRPPITETKAPGGQADRQVIGLITGHSAAWPGSPGSIYSPVSGS